MSLLNWPEGIDRTDPEDRDDCNKFSVSLAKTRRDLSTEMDLMGVDQWRIEEVGGGGGDPGVVVRWKDDGVEYAAACDKWDTKTANLREAYLWVNETRMRSQRPVETADDSFAAARLPSGDEDSLDLPAKTEAMAILGVEPGADDERIKEAYRARIKDAHADQGGSSEAAKEVIDAYQKLTGERV